MDKKAQIDFFAACNTNDLAKVQEIMNKFKKSKIKKHIVAAFSLACKNNYLEMIELLYSQIEPSEIAIQFKIACWDARLDVARSLWGLSNHSLYLLGQDDHHSEDGDATAAAGACCEGHLDVLKWLYHISNNTILSKKEDKNYFFEIACTEGYLDIAQWLYSVFGSDIDIHRDNDQILILTDQKGHDEVSKWIYNTGKEIINQHAKNSRILRNIIRKITPNTYSSNYTVCQYT